MPTVEAHRQLERAFRGPLGELPRGIREGQHLGFLDGAVARRPEVRLVHSALFVVPRWGIDFERRLWWFGRPELALGRFRIERGPSRWRDAEVLQLHYDVSRLPVRGLLTRAATSPTLRDTVPIVLRVTDPMATPAPESAEDGSTS